MQLLTTATVLALVTGALARPACVGNGYGTFYDSNNCSGGGTQAFSMGNSGCIANMSGKNSIYIQGSCNFGTYSLVWSPGSNCNCQNHCSNVPNQGDNGCWNLNGNPGANSFRFIHQGCGGNNC